MRVCPVCKRKVLTGDERPSDLDTDSEDENTPLINSEGGTQGGTFANQRVSLVLNCLGVIRLDGRVCPGSPLIACLSFLLKRVSSTLHTAPPGEWSKAFSSLGLEGWEFVWSWIIQSINYQCRKMLFFFFTWLCIFRWAELQFKHSKLIIMNTSLFHVKFNTQCVLIEHSLLQFMLWKCCMWTKKTNSSSILLILLCIYHLTLSSLILGYSHLRHLRQLIPLYCLKVP